MVAYVVNTMSVFIFQINGIPVERITRRGAEAVNFVTEEIPADTEVEMKVDWSRRFDNMQQHSGMEYRYT